MSDGFWVLDAPRRRTARWDRGNLWRKSDYVDCPQSTGKEDYLTFGGPANRIGDLRVILHSTEVSDFVWTIPDCLIQDRVLEIFQDAGLTGFVTRPVNVRQDLSCVGEKDHAQSPLPSMYELMVTGWGGVVAPGCGVRRIGESNVWEGFPDWTRAMDPDDYDGSDFFIIWPFAFTRLVSRKAAKVIRKHNLTGVRLVSLEDYTRMHMSSKPGRITPMRLRDHFPDERARVIGEPLGIY